MRPAVGDDVVHGQRAARAPRRPAAAAAPRSSGPRREVERPARPPPRPGARASRLARRRRQAGEVDHRQRRTGGRRRDHLHRRVLRPAAKVVRSASWRRTTSPKAARQERAGRAAREAQRHRQVVERAARLEPVEEPEPLLGEGERQGPSPRQPARSGGRRRRLLRPGARARTPPREPATVGASKRVRSGSSTPNARGARDELGGEQRVAAQLEEAVVGAHLGRCRAVSPDPGEPPLGRGARRHVGRVDPGRAWPEPARRPRAGAGSVAGRGFRRREARRGLRARAGPRRTGHHPHSRATPAPAVQAGSAAAPSGSRRTAGAAAASGSRQARAARPRPSSAGARRDRSAAAPGGAARRRGSRPSRSPRRRARAGPARSSRNALVRLRGRARGAARRRRPRSRRALRGTAGAPGWPERLPGPTSSSTRPGSRQQLGDAVGEAHRRAQVARPVAGIGRLRRR